MKRIILLVAVVFATIAYAIPEDEVHRVVNKPITEKETEFDKFLNALSMRESTNNPDTFNTLGYIGEFQFGRLALKDVGLDTITYKKFRKNPKIFPQELQRKAVTKLMKLNRRRMKRLINKYEGKTVNGIKITESGLLAAAHIAGAGGVKAYFKRGKNPSDAYGTKLSDYLEEFSGYKIKMV